MIFNLVDLTEGSLKFSAQVRRLAAAMPLQVDLPQPSAETRQRQKRITPERAVLLAADYKAGADINSLARTYGIHRHGVRAHLSKAGVEIRRRGLS